MSSHVNNPELSIYRNLVQLFFIRLHWFVILHPSPNYVLVHLNLVNISKRHKGVRRLPVLAIEWALSTEIEEGFNIQIIVFRGQRWHSLKISASKLGHKFPQVFQGHALLILFLDEIELVIVDQGHLDDACKRPKISGLFLYLFGFSKFVVKIIWFYVLGLISLLS